MDFKYHLNWAKEGLKHTLLGDERQYRLQILNDGGHEIGFPWYDRYPEGNIPQEGDNTQVHFHAFAGSADFNIPVRMVKVPRVLKFFRPKVVAWYREREEVPQAD